MCCLASLFGSSLAALLPPANCNRELFCSDTVMSKNAVMTLEPHLKMFSLEVWAGGMGRGELYKNAILSLSIEIEKKNISM